MTDKKWVKFHWCKWSKWADIRNGTISWGETGERPVIIQEKRCLICNKAKQRFCYADEH